MSECCPSAISALSTTLPRQLVLMIYEVGHGVWMRFAAPGWVFELSQCQGGDHEVSSAEHASKSIIHMGMTALLLKTSKNWTIQGGLSYLTTRTSCIHIWYLEELLGASSLVKWLTMWALLYKIQLQILAYWTRVITSMKESRGVVLATFEERI